MPSKLFTAILTGALVLAFAPAPAHAAAEEHCAVRVIGKKADGELMTSPPECRSTYSDALAAVGVGGADTLQAGATSDELQAFAATSSTIGTHYDGFGLTGSSFSVVGSDCSGGWLNLSTTWKNRVSSTANGCPRIRHWDGDNRTGAWEETYGAGANLSTLNNKANSIQYLS